MAIEHAVLLTDMLRMYKELATLAMTGDGLQHDIFAIGRLLSFVNDHFEQVICAHEAEGDPDGRQA